MGCSKLQLLWVEDSITAPTAVPPHHLSSAPGLQVASELMADERIHQSPMYGYAATQSRGEDVVLFCRGMKWPLTRFFLPWGKSSLPFILDNCDWILLFGVTHYLELWRMIDWLSEREIWSKLTICSEDKRDLSSVSPKEAKLRLLSLHRKSNNRSDIKTDLIVTKDIEDYAGYRLSEVSYYI